MNFLKKLSKVVEKKYEWPNTSAPDKTDKFWEFNNNMNCNGVHYMKAEVSPGKWHWVVDEKTEAHAREYQDSRRNLYWALRSRVLTEDEMLRVERYGDNLNIEPMIPYRSEEKKRELNDALLQQFKLQRAAHG